MTTQAELPGTAPEVAPHVVASSPHPTSGPARVAAMSVWVAAVALWWWRIGIPNDSLTVIVTLWLGTIAWNIEAPWRRHLLFVRDWALPASVLVFYFFSRGLSD